MTKKKTYAGGKRMKLNPNDPIVRESPTFTEACASNEAVLGDFVTDEITGVTGCLIGETEIEDAATWWIQPKSKTGIARPALVPLTVASFIKIGRPASLKNKPVPEPKFKLGDKVYLTDTGEAAEVLSRKRILGEPTIYGVSALPRSGYEADEPCLAQYPEHDLEEYPTEQLEEYQARFSFLRGNA